MQLCLSALRFIVFTLMVLWVGQIKVKDKEIGRWWVEFAQQTGTNAVESIRNSEAYQSLFAKRNIRLSKRDLKPSASPNSEEDINSDEQASLMKILQ